MSLPEDLTVVLVWLAALALGWGLPKVMDRYTDWRERRRHRRYRVSVCYDEPWAWCFREVTITLRRPITEARLAALRERLQREQQAAKPPLILSMVELEE